MKNCFEIILETLPNEICKYLSLVDFIHLYLMTSKRIKTIIGSKRLFLTNVIKEVTKYEYIKDRSLIYFIANLSCKDLRPELLEEGKVHTLDLSYTKVANVSALGAGKIHTLNLSGTEVTDVSMLGAGTVHTLDLSGTKVKNVSALGAGKVHTLYLSTNVTDVSMLGNVHIIQN